MAYIRGAITANNTFEDIDGKSNKLISEIFASNKININDVSAIIFTVTDDIDVVNPCTCVRKKNGGNCAYMCFSEGKFVGMLSHCIRICVVVDKFAQSQAKHVYLDGASILRPDLNT